MYKSTHGWTNGRYCPASNRKSEKSRGKKKQIRQCIEQIRGHITAWSSTWPWSVNRTGNHPDVLRLLDTAMCYIILTDADHCNLSDRRTLISSFIGSLRSKSAFSTLKDALEKYIVATICKSDSRISDSSIRPDSRSRPARSLLAPYKATEKGSELTNVNVVGFTVLLPYFRIDAGTHGKVLKQSMN